MVSFITVFRKNIATKLTTLTYGYDVSLRIADLVGNEKALGQIIPYNN